MLLLYVESMPTQTKTFDDLHALPDLRTFLKTANEMKYFLLVLLWDKLYTVPDNRNTLLRVLEVLRRGDYY